MAREEVQLYVKIAPDLDQLSFEQQDMIEELRQSFKDRGGYPIVIGVCQLLVGQTSRYVPRYKVQFPNGSVDYLRIDTFDKWYSFVREEEKED